MGFERILIPPFLGFCFFILKKKFFFSCVLGRIIPFGITLYIFDFHLKRKYRDSISMDLLFRDGFHKWVIK